MRWQEARKQYPNRWLIIEALEAHSDFGKRILEELTVINTFKEASPAMKDYSSLHKQFPAREMYVVHTEKQSLDIIEQKWTGMRNSGKI